MTSDKTKIIIIDDEEDLCFLLSNLLIAQGFEVQSFFTLKDGLSAIETCRPHWVIIDNDLPDGRGWDETEKIRRTTPGINIIKISANPDSERSGNFDNVHYLIKPIHVNSITSLIKNNSVSS